MSSPISVIGSPGIATNTVESMLTAWNGSVVDSQSGSIGSVGGKPVKLHTVVDVPGRGMHPAGFKLGLGMATSLKAVLSVPEATVEMLGQSRTTALPTVCPT